MKKLIRRLLNSRGYDLIKTDEFREVYPDISDVSGLSFYRTPIGNYYVPEESANDPVARAMARGRIFEPEVVEAASRYIEPKSIVLDVGANYGQMSMLFSRTVGEGGEVYSFEAQEFVFDVLKRNIEANGCRNIRPVFGAVYDKRDMDLVFPVPDFKRFGAYGSYGIDPRATSGNIVKSLTIDSMQIDKPISFMKIDIQGSDLHALRGAVNTIREHKMPIIFEYEQQFQDEFNTTFQDYVDFVNEINYRFESTILDINYLILPR